MPAVFRTASFGQRAAASFIDGVIVLVASGVMYLFDATPNVWVYVLARAMYEVGLTATSGQTLGKRMIGTRVVVDDAPTTAPPPLSACIARWGVFGMPALLPDPLGTVLGFIVVLIALYGICTDERARGIHDHVARTRVIEAR